MVILLSAHLVVLRMMLRVSWRGQVVVVSVSQSTWSPLLLLSSPEMETERRGNSQSGIVVLLLTKFLLNSNDLTQLPLSLLEQSLVSQLCLKKKNLINLGINLGTGILYSGKYRFVKTWDPKLDHTVNVGPTNLTSDILSDISTFISSEPLSS